MQTPPQPGTSTIRLICLGVGLTLAVVSRILAIPPLAGEWTFDNPAGRSAADTAGGSHHGTLSAGADFVNINPRRFITLSAAANGYVSMGKVPPELAFVGASTSFSISLWIRMDPANTDCSVAISTNVQGVDSGYLIGVNQCSQIGAPKMAFFSQSAFAPTLTPTSTIGITDGLWHLLVAVHDGAASRQGARLYVDGNPPTTTDISPIKKVPVDAFLLIGGLTTAEGTPKGFFTGKIDDVRIYSGVLSDKEVADIFNSRPGPSHSLFQHPLGISIGLGLIVFSLILWNMRSRN
jgi:hypothetical protein